MINTLWYQESPENILKLLKTNNERGLTGKEVEKKADRKPNVLEEGQKISPFSIFFKQFTDTMVIVLLCATVISGIIGAMADAITIMAIVILNAILGLYRNTEPNAPWKRLRNWQHLTLGYYEMEKR